MRQAKRVREAELKRVQAEAARTCRKLWSKASECIDHPYIKGKGVKPYGLRQLRNMLLVPIYLDGTLVNLQFIPAEPDPETGKRDKKFKRGGCVKGCYYAIGNPSSIIYICEGFATGASIFEAVGGMVVLAFDCGNLKPAAEAIRKEHPKAAIVIAGDNDDFQNCQHKDCQKPVRLSTDGDICPHCDRPHGKTNTGKVKAEAAAKVVSGRSCVPDFDGLDITDKPTDFNDLAALAGLDAVGEQIEVGAAGDTQASGFELPFEWKQPPFNGTLILNAAPK